MSFLEINDLTLYIDKHLILDDLSFDVWEGHVHALVGPNGAGKSSLAYAIMGLEGYRDYQGEIIFKGQSLKGLSVSDRARLGIALAWQEPARYEGLTVRRFLNAASTQSVEETNDLVGDFLSRMGMDPADYLDRTMDSSLSGGERKKIELASILAMDPGLVLLDEPDSGIDVASLDRIFDALEFFKEQGTTVLVITHSEAALRETEHAFLMCCGKLIDKGKVEDIAQYFGEECIPCNHKNRPKAGEVR